MGHLADGTLRRLLDEPFAVPMAERLHLENCTACRQRLGSIAEDAHVVSALFGAGNPEVEHGVALASFRSSLLMRPAEGRGRRCSTLARGIEDRAWSPKRWLRPSAALGLAAFVILGCLLTPAGSFAHNFLTVFQPNTYQIVPVTAGELQGLPNLSDFGVMSSPPQGVKRTAETAVAAGTLADMHVAVPASVPGDIPRRAAYDVMSPTWAAFEFSAARARASEATKGHSVPPMPRQLDHSVLRLSVGSIVISRYGAPTSGELTVPSLVIVQAPRPVLTSSGAPVEVIEQYLLSLPGVSDSLRRQIRAIGDPSVTLPIPIPIDAMSAQSITIKGVHGLAIGDSTRLGSGVLWQKKGTVYAVVGAMPLKTVMSIAESLQ